MIEINNLTKEFRKPVREQGVKGMFKTLFSKKYVSKIAVNNVNFTINEGEIVGYIGSNGAGKSTTIKMMWASSSRTRMKTTATRSSAISLAKKRKK